MWPVRLYHTSTHYLINGEFFGKKVIGHKMVVILSVTFV